MSHKLAYDSRRYRQRIDFISHNDESQSMDMEHVQGLMPVAMLSTGYKCSTKRIAEDVLAIRRSRV